MLRDTCTSNGFREKSKFLFVSTFSDGKGKLFLRSRPLKSSELFNLVYTYDLEVLVCVEDLDLRERRCFLHFHPEFFDFNVVIESFHRFAQSRRFLAVWFNVFLILTSFDRLSFLVTEETLPEARSLIHLLLFRSCLCVEVFLPEHGELRFALIVLIIN